MAVSKKRTTKKPVAKKKPVKKTTAAKKPKVKIASNGKQAELKKLAKKVVKQLAIDFPDVECALIHDSPFQLLIATILSAQCTDARVNLVTPNLFKKFPTPAHFARAKIASIEKAVRSTGFYRNKAKNIQGCCKRLVEEHDGEIPQTMPALVALPGVGRKTANVVLGTAFGIATGVVVDTHVGRISKRLGLSKAKDAVKIERDLVDLLPKKDWINYSHRMIYHGRQVCASRKPKCEICTMEKYCPKVEVG